jgi:adenosylcobinamide-GDP ribazoletransferase
MLWVMSSSDYVRSTGAGSAVAGGIDRPALIVALVTTGVALLPLVLVVPIASVITGLAGLVLGHVAMRRWYEPRLGGYTGDCLGSVQQCSEVGFYLGLLVALAA